MGLFCWSDGWSVGRMDGLLTISKQRRRLLCTCACFHSTLFPRPGEMHTVLQLKFYPNKTETNININMR